MGYVDKIDENDLSNEEGKEDDDFTKFKKPNELEIEDVIKKSRNLNKRLNYEVRTRVLMQDLENHCYLKTYMKHNFPVPSDDEEEINQSKEVSEIPRPVEEDVLSDEIGQENKIQKA